jgi:hypothetical protein
MIDRIVNDIFVVFSGSDAAIIIKQCHVLGIKSKYFFITLHFINGTNKKLCQQMILILALTGVNNFIKLQSSRKTTPNEEGIPYLPPGNVWAAL